MIHVAPCSCELHVRIRELEADREMVRRLYIETVARAEKAEARVAELERYKELTEQAERLEREAD